MFNATISPRATLPAEWIQSPTNPNAPVLWYGLPVSLGTFREYVVKKGNPEDIQLDTLTFNLVPSATRPLRKACNHPNLVQLDAMYLYTEELRHVVAFKRSVSPSAARLNPEVDERTASAMKKEMGLLDDRPALWHFDWDDSDKVCQVSLCPFT